MVLDQMARPYQLLWQESKALRVYERQSRLAKTT